MRHALRFSATLFLFLAALAAPALAGVRAGGEDRIDVEAALDKAVFPANARSTAYLRVQMTGFAMPESERPPLNLAIVVDRSGSMQGDKILKAREAAVRAVKRLGPRDVVSVVCYESTVEVLVPATKASDKEAILGRIRGIQAGGSTALFGGVSKAAEELRKFLEPTSVNRIVLLSDGLANVGPQTPEELGRLGAALAKEGISVTTIGLGLGYNEDLMALLAMKSDANHYFAEQADDLAQVFDRELGRALSLAAQDLEIEIRCAEGVRPIRILGREGTIDGRTAKVLIRGLGGEAAKRVVIEVETPSVEAQGERPVAEVEIRYLNLKTGQPDLATAVAAVAFADDEAAVEASVDKEVTADAVKLVATEQNILAMRLRDEGKVEQAQQVLYSNAAYLQQNAKQLESEDLQMYFEQNEEDARNVGDDAVYRRQRKAMRETQVFNVTK